MCGQDRISPNPNVSRLCVAGDDKKMMNRDLSLTMLAYEQDERTQANNLAVYVVGFNGRVAVGKCTSLIKET